MGGFLSEVCSNQASLVQRWLAGQAPRTTRPLVVGDALQIGEYLLNLHQTLLEGGHGKHGELVARVDGKNGQEPPAAGRTVGRRLEEQNKVGELQFHRRSTYFDRFYHLICAGEVVRSRSPTCQQQWSVLLQSFSILAAKVRH